MKKILIIDDDIHIGNFMDEALSREGYHVFTLTPARKRCCSCRGQSRI